VDAVDGQGHMAASGIDERLRHRPSYGIANTVGACVRKSWNGQSPGLWRGL